MRRLTDECIPWHMYIDRGGYGRLCKDGRQGTLAHRHIWEECFGPIPDGLHMDHLCRNRRCVNPNHLEPVTPRENVLRGLSAPAIHAAKTQCVNGHPFDAENMTIDTRGARVCRTCARARNQAYKARLKAAA